jgi:hypothetical protein
MELTVRATRLQRPMARMRVWVDWVAEVVGGTASLYHIQQFFGQFIARRAG